PRPPCAATYLVRAPTRSASTPPSAVLTTVPSGTATIRSAPSAPLRCEPEPCLPLPARRTGRRCRSSSGAMPGSTPEMTSPPPPPPAAAAPTGAAGRFDLPRGPGGAAGPAGARLHRDGDVVGELGHFLIASWVALAATCREGGPACGPPSTYALLCAVAEPSP